MMYIGNEAHWAKLNYMESVYLMTVHEQQLHETTEVLTWVHDRLWIVKSTTLLDTFGAPSEYWVVVRNYEDDMATQFQLDDYTLMYYRNS
jgi:hypothetical protein